MALPPDSVYDPAKRREYYLRTRELKGLKRGSRVVPPKGKPGLADLKTTLRKPSATKPAPHKPKSNLAEVHARRVAVEAKVKVLNEKLKQLRTVLKGLKDQSDKSNKVKGEKPEGADKGPAKRKEPTAAQKKEASKKAKEERADDPEVKLKNIMEKISKLQDQIKEARAKLANPGRRKSSSEKPKV
jgi:chromosome segregation ATPase